MRNLFILSLFLLFSCKPSILEHTTTIDLNDQSIGNYVVEFSKREISVKQDLVFRLSGAVVNAEEVGKTLDESLTSITPRVKGKAFWKDMSTIVFSPDELLTYNTEYTFTIKIGSLFDNVPENLQKVSFPFRTRAVDYSIHTNHINYDPQKDERLTLSGEIVSSDFVEENWVKELLTASQEDNNEIDILWSHNSNGETHTFQVVNIKRKETPSVLLLEWKDGRFNSGFSGKQSLDIYAKGDFKIVSAETLKGNRRTILISLTEPADRSQSLEGLIKLSNYSGKLSYDISGSQIKVYPESSVQSPFTIEINKAVLNSTSEKLKNNYKKELSFDPIKPSVILAGNGVIVPHNNEIIFPFEAINLKGVTVEVFKIFSDNVLQFLQYNKLNSTYGLDPVGRVIHQENIKLTNLSTNSNDANYIRYSLDLSKMIDPDPGAIYQVRIGFNQQQVASYPCEEEVPQAVLVSQRDGFTSIMDQNENYNWNDRDNPCKSAYFNSSRIITRNVLGSNIGIIAKMDKKEKVHMILSDLRTIAAIAGANITFYDFQQQEIISTKSDAEGMVSIQLERNPSFAIVKIAGDFGYVNLQDQYANSLSEFEVSGKSKNSGIDGYIYGERGVWRPGDTLYLNFMLEDGMNTLPKNHPVTMTIRDSRGKEKYNRTRTSHTGQIYHFPVITNDNDPTGNWSAVVQVGGRSFQKMLKVETVKPNRLKIQYDIQDGQSLALYQDQKVGLTSAWLHGAPADALKAKVEMQLLPKTTGFKGYSEFNFSDPARRIEAMPITVFDNVLNAEGKADISIKKKKEWLAPGKLRANFKTKVFEKGGNFSEDNFSMDADVYNAYVGIKIPTTRWGSKFIKEETPTDIPIVVVDADGAPLANRNLSIGLYQAEWDWWYDQGYSQRYNYNSSSHNGAVSTGKIKTNSKGEAFYNVEFEEYGNYMIRVCDDESGHCTGDLFYTGYSWSSDRSQDGPQLLTFKTDKSSYQTGENIEVKIPSNLGSKILMSIENGEKILKTFWVEGKKDETIINIPAEPSMNSNVYLHAHLIQPHNNGENDLPMRMFGIVPISVIDAKSQIEPELKMPKVIEPNTEFTIQVSEKLGRSMHYTIAVVDEGLLDLTRFKTPDPWNHFFAKQALGVKTWDIYDLVLDGYGGSLDRLISIGGDDGTSTEKDGKKANRFVPVVRHLGPFTLGTGEVKDHKIRMPNYVGSVKTMVVAREKMAYGSIEETTPVKKPLMVLATLPRVLGPSETLTLPANVFAMDKKVKNVNVTVETTPNVVIEGLAKKSLVFDKIGDQQAYFDMKVGNEMGAASVKIRAQGNGESAYDEVNIEIRNPNPFTSKVFEASIEPGQSWDMNYELFGTTGSNEGVLELSNIPPMDFGRRLKYLIRYPYGCIEQTTSSAFPQLYLSEVADLDEKEVYKVEKNIKRAIERLSLFQISSGGFSYWPGDSDFNDWGSNYALHFLIEAKEKGYYVSDNMFEAAIKFLDVRASNTNLPEKIGWNNYWIGRVQAYRLYVLAKAGRANVGAMNILKNYNHLDLAASHMLAASYALIGKIDIAREMVANKELKIQPYVETGYTYGSHVRDLAMMAEAQQIIGNKNENAQLIKEIAREMSSNNWYSTQTTAYALLSLGKFLSAYEKDDLKYNYKLNNGKVEIGTTKKASVQKMVDVESSNIKNLQVKNTSSSILFARFVLSGQSPPGVEEPAFNHHIKLDVSYTDMKGLSIDPTKIEQGSDFIAKVIVSNLGSRKKNIQELALSQIFPSGWEILNERLSSISNFTANSPFDYQDIRDDRVYTFFDIYGEQKLSFSVLLNASYAGRFYHSPMYVEAMYDNEIQAKSPGFWVEVLPQAK